MERAAGAAAATGSTTCVRKEQSEGRSELSARAVEQPQLDIQLAQKTDFAVAHNAPLQPHTQQVFKTLCYTPCSAADELHAELDGAFGALNLAQSRLHARESTTRFHPPCSRGR